MPSLTNGTTTKPAGDKAAKPAFRRPAVVPRRSSIKPEKLLPMDKSFPSLGSDEFRVVFISAGNIMFGSDEGPWNHSFRFEHKLGPRLRVIALIEPAKERAEAAIRKKCQSFVACAYQETRIFKSLADYIENMEESERPRAFVVGSPPYFRGSTKPGRDLELQILKHFPGVPMFIEKPVATGPEDEIGDCFKVAKAIDESRIVCSVGYMLRYLRAVQMMKGVIEENNLTVMATVARYTCAYEKIAKPDWWDKSKSLGPIVEQGTHFCDLSRYFGGEVDISSVNAHSLEWSESAGKLSKVPVDEAEIPPEDRISRVTSATWKYENGAVGSLTHSVTLHGTNYSCELEVLCDGYSMRLVDPYEQPVVYIRRPGDDHDETHRFPDDDPFYSEVSHWIDAIEEIEDDPDTRHILSSFEDACRTYEFSWAIRRASERNHKPFGHVNGLKN